MLASHPVVDNYDLSSLWFLCSGAAPLGDGFVKRVRERLRGCGVNMYVTQGYGLTETSPVCLLLPLEQSEVKMGSAGVLLANLEARLVKMDGTDASEGEPGELWIRGPIVMK